ncbi:MAG: hypothetical protein M1819_005382 [Sarea resinae]|nr:MAG: hypothetical protein M1819_005382 [Sarea resinae]
MPNPNRILQACKNCRQRKVKCDGSRPACQRCLTRGDSCRWPDELVQGGYVAISDDTDEARVRAEPAFSSPASIAASGFEPDGAGSSEISQHRLGRLLDIFWTGHHAVELCGFLHRGSFEAQLFEPGNAFLLSAIISLSSLYVSNDEAREAYGFASSKALSDHYASRARQHSRDSSDNPIVRTVQANLVLGLRELLAMTDCKAWMYVGLAIRMAQALRMRKEYNQLHHPREREIRRRTFWACVTLDRLVAFSTFRTQTIEVDLVTIHLPCTEAAFAFGQDEPGPTVEDMRSSMPNTTEPGILPYFIVTVILWGDMGAHYVNRGRRAANQPPNDPSGAFYKAELAMRQWMLKLPRELLWSYDNLQGHRSLGQDKLFVNMHFLIHHTLFVAHQEYLPLLEASLLGDFPVDAGMDAAGTPFEYYDESMVASCLFNADSVTEMVRLLSVGRNLNSDPFCSTFGGLAMLSAANIYLWGYFPRVGAASPDQGQVDILQSKANFDFLLDTVKSWRGRWELASAWANALELLFVLYQIAFGEAGEPLDDSPYSYVTIDKAPSESVGLTPSASNAEDELSNTPRRFQLREGDGLPDSTALISQGLYYKIRVTLGLAMENAELCQRMLRLSKEKMWQNVWLHKSIYEAMKEPEAFPSHVLM